MIGILLVNLGTPDSPHPDDVYRYLKEFLLDPYVIDLPYVVRELLVRGIIIPFRYKRSSKSYQKIWQDTGSPLLYHSNELAKKLRNSLGEDYKVVLAMRYGNPSIQSALSQFQGERLIVVPLFPQYATATTGSIIQLMPPDAKILPYFYDHPLYIEAYKAKALRFPLDEYDHFVFSYHGLPLRQIKKADTTYPCYQKACHETSEKLINALSLDPKKCTTSFQSRLGIEKWLTPATSRVVEERAKLGEKKLLLFSPSFVADCLETLFELGIEAKEQFEAAGGTQLDLVPALNADPLWAENLAKIIRNL